MNQLEQVLRRSHCSDLDSKDCVGTIIITGEKVILACKRCGNEHRSHDKKNIFGQPAQDHLPEEVFRTVLQMKLNETEIKDGA